jgi:hypothetical protein
MKAQANTCFANVKQQTLDPTVWQMACDELRTKYGHEFAGESLKLMKIIGDLKGQGCTLADPKQAGKLVLECESYAAHAICLETLMPDGQKYCAKPTMKISDMKSAEQTATAGAQPSAAALGAAAAQAGQSARAAQPGTAQQRQALQRPTQVGDTQAANATTGRTRQVSSVFEAEQLLTAGKTQLRGGQAVAQGMAGFGPGWSGDAQVFWHGATVGATLDLLIDVPADGAWTVEIALTQAPDYGQLAFEVDHHPVERPFDGYAPRVAGPVTVALGTFAMIHGPRPVSLKIVGRNPAASGWLVGIDRVVLKPADGK